MVGIGSAPNSHLMARAAELGRGSVVHIGGGEQVEERMRALFGKLERPAVTDVKVQFSESGVDVTPKVLPDLYAGEALQIAAKLTAFSGTMQISGMIGEQPWIAKLPLKGAAEGKGLSKLWARAKIDDAETGVTLGHISQVTADQRVLDLALEHSLISRRTSLVAVDKTPSRPADARLSRADLPLNLPAGWEFDKVFGGERGQAGERAEGGKAPVTQEGEALKLDAAYIEKIAVTHKPGASNLSARQPVASVSLPKTATDARLYIVIGALLLIANLWLVMLALRREKRGWE
jgi:Ca-activated chloride channel family protein